MSMCRSSRVNGFAARPATLRPSAPPPWRRYWDPPITDAILLIRRAVVACRPETTQQPPSMAGFQPLAGQVHQCLLGSHHFGTRRAAFRNRHALDVGTVRAHVPGLTSIAQHGL